MLRILDVNYASDDCAPPMAIGKTFPGHTHRVYDQFMFFLSSIPRLLLDGSQVGRVDRVVSR